MADRATQLAPVVVLALWSGSAAWAQSGVEDLLKGAAAGFDARTFYMDAEDKSAPPAVTTKEAWTIGGKLYGRTGYWGPVQFGASYYLSAPLYAPGDTDATLLLEPDQDSISVIGEAFARLKFGEAVATAGRQEIEMSVARPEGVRSNRGDSTYLGKLDIRMVPVTYEAVTASFKAMPTLDFHAGWVNKVKPRNESSFESVGKGFGAGGSDADMWYGGVHFSPTKDSRLQAWYHVSPDIIRIAFAEGEHTIRLAEHSHLRFAAQYTDQRSDGSNELTGSSFSTSNAQAYAEYGMGMFHVYGAYSRTGSGAALRLPFSAGPIYTFQLMRQFVRAHEKAWQLGADFNLAQWAPGVSAYVAITSGTDAINPGTGAALHDETEYDLGAVWVYRAQGSWLDGLRSRIRYSWAIDEFAAGNQRSYDFRIDVNLPIRFL